MDRGQIHVYVHGDSLPKRVYAKLIDERNMLLVGDATRCAEIDIIFGESCMYGVLLIL